MKRKKSGINIKVNVVSPNLVGDYSDPYAPPVGERRVQCLGCGCVYSSTEIRWDPPARKWVCRYWPECIGFGYQFWIYDADDRRFEGYVG